MTRGTNSTTLTLDSQEDYHSGSWNVTIGDFQVLFQLCFRESLGAKPFIWKFAWAHLQCTCNFWFIYMWIKLIFIWKALHQGLLKWNRGERQLGYHLLYRHLTNFRHMYKTTPHTHYTGLYCTTPRTLWGTISNAIPGHSDVLAPCHHCLFYCLWEQRLLVCHPPVVW